MNCTELIKALDYIVEQSDEHKNLMLFGTGVIKPTMPDLMHDLFVITIEAHHKHIREFVAELKAKLLAPSDEPKKDFDKPPWEIKP